MARNVEVTSRSASRRKFLLAGGASAAAATLPPAVSAGVVKWAGDVAILNVALGLEHQAIAAYNAGAASKLLSEAHMKIAVSFLNDHKRHRDALAQFIRRFGGTPVEPQKSYDFGKIGSAEDILKLAQKLEEGAEIAYLTNAGNLKNKELLNAAVPILEDEVRHNIVFRQALKMDVVTRLKY